MVNLYDEIPMMNVFWLTTSIYAQRTWPQRLDVGYHPHEDMEDGIPGAIYWDQSIKNWHKRRVPMPVAQPGV